MGTAQSSGPALDLLPGRAGQRHRSAKHSRSVGLSLQNALMIRREFHLALLIEHSFIAQVALTKSLNGRRPRPK